MKQSVFCSLFIVLNLILYGQYNPELDIRGSDDKGDGAELQLATPTNNHYLRFFSGRVFDPNPFVYFSHADTFHFASGGTDFSGFSPLMTVLGSGEIGIGTANPMSKLHIDGDVTNPWAMTWYHYNPQFTEDYQFLPWLRRSWSGQLWDHLYIGTTGNSGSQLQPAMMLSRKQGILFGKGHNDADQLSDEHVRIDTVGKVQVNSLSGDRSHLVIADSDGVLHASTAALATHFSPWIMQIANNASPLMLVGNSVYDLPRITTSNNVDSAVVLFPLPLKTGSIDSVTICYDTNDQVGDGQVATIQSIQFVIFDDFQPIVAGSGIYPDSGCERTAVLGYDVGPGFLHVSMVFALGVNDFIDVGRISVHYSP